MDANKPINVKLIWKTLKHCVFTILIAIYAKTKKFIKLPHQPSNSKSILKLLNKSLNNSVY